MLSAIEKSTWQLKLKLIEFGYELPPPSVIHSSKIKQINMDFKQMSDILLTEHGDGRKSLFTNAQNVLMVCTAKYHVIQNLDQLLLAINQTCFYLSSY